ncbi:alpha/beta hydrolase [Colwellia sp. E2M01]|uniref:alpha/beta fold hydrolase n=1 Tax=Colwellia sp. E2M01 TaxID=2841561 RepID=UPI001C09BBC6|nr:alpha/beta hydrolase [Colwellia sp. E2M01]MBU2871831.1 alpha/beta hydrolase [Colwellia sp. E2M01]
MSKHIINFAHANGFPANCYQTLFSYLPTDIKVIALDKYGHDPKKPVNHNWQAQVDELIAYVESQQIDFGNRSKVICLGHSLGGVISFIACCQRPDLFKALIMLDPPVLTGASAMMVGMLKKTRWIDKFSPAGKAKSRRTHWPLTANTLTTETLTKDISADLKKISASFARRTLFKNFDKRCLTDYITHGICQRNNQLELVFDAQIEAEIFRNLPSNLSCYKNKLTVPAVLIHGESTDVFPHKMFHNFAKLNKNITLKTIPGGHMFPLESPEATAKLITTVIESLPNN